MYISNINYERLALRDDGKEHYWIVLLDDGRYKELYNTFTGVVEWCEGYKQSYRLVRWDD